MAAQHHQTNPHVFDCYLLGSRLPASPSLHSNHHPCLAILSPQALSDSTLL